MKKISMLDVVIANKDIYDNDSDVMVRTGFKGVVLEIWKKNKVFLVEFFDLNEETIGNGMTTVSIDDIDLLIKYDDEKDKIV